MNRYLCIALAGILLSLAACDGSGTKTSPAQVPGAVNPPPVNPPPPEKPPPVPPPPRTDYTGGTWYGELTNSTQNTSEYVLALVSEDGRFRLVGFNVETFKHSDSAFVGSLTFTGESFTGSGTAIAGDGKAWVDNSQVASVMIDGQVTTDDSGFTTLAGTWTTSSGDAGTFSLPYLTYYHGFPDSLAWFTWTWERWGTGPNSNVILTIADDGTIDGNDGEGCSLGGQIEKIDDRFNLVDITYVRSDCDLAGTYTGLALLDDWYWAMHMSVDNGTQEIAITLFARWF